MKFKEVCLGVTAVSFLLLIIFLSLLLGEKFQVQSCGCPKMVSQNFVYLFIFLAGIFIASLVYYLAALKIETKDQIISKNLEIVYSLLDDKEKKVLGKIIENNGKIAQSKLNKEFGRLNVHRTLKKLEQKNIIDIESKKNRNFVELKDELKQELVE